MVVLVAVIGGRIQPGRSTVSLTCSTQAVRRRRLSRVTWQVTWSWWSRPTMDVCRSASASLATTGSSGVSSTCWTS